MLRLTTLLLAAICLISPSRAERMIVERVVPAGATLAYSEGGVVVRTIAVPPGRVRVTIEYGGPVTPRHGGTPR